MYRKTAPSDCNLSVLLNYVLHPCNVHIFPSFAGQTGASNILHVRPSFSKLAAQYSGMLHTHYAITTRIYAMAVNFNNESNFRA